MMEDTESLPEDIEDLILQWQIIGMTGLASYLRKNLYPMPTRGETSQIARRMRPKFVALALKNPESTLEEIARICTAIAIEAAYRVLGPPPHQKN